MKKEKEKKKKMKIENKMMKEQGKYIKGRLMGSLLVLVCPCLKCNRHMQNCVFLCSLDDFLLKM